MFSIGSCIKKIRERSGITQVDLAKKMGISRSQIIKWEGRNSNPGISTLQNIADNLNVTIQDIIGVYEQKASSEVGQRVARNNEEHKKAIAEQEAFKKVIYDDLELVLERGEDEMTRELVNHIDDCAKKVREKDRSWFFIKKKAAGE